MAYSDTYTLFRSEVSSWCDASDVTTTSFDSTIATGEKYVNRKLRVTEMETALAVTVNSLGTATLPSDYLDAQFLYVDVAPTQWLVKRSPEWIYRNYADRAATGTPKFVAETNSTFIFGPHPSAADVIKGTYYARPQTMVSLSTLGPVHQEYSEIYLWAALANAELFLGRDQRIAWQQKCDEAIERANQETRKRRYAGGPLNATPG